MSRDYRQIQNGKFKDVESFNVNVGGCMFLGAVFDLLNLPVSAIPGGGVSVPHEVTGEVQMRVLSFLKSPNYETELQAAIAIACESEGSQPGLGDYQWTLDFMRLAENPEGFASDYCEQYL